MFCIKQSNTNNDRYTSTTVNICLNDDNCKQNTAHRLLVRTFEMEVVFELDCFLKGALKIFITVEPLDITC